MIYVYIFYGSLILMPIILLLIFLTLDRCRVWGKKATKELVKLNGELNYGEVNRVMNKAADSLTEFNERAVQNFERFRDYEIKRSVRDSIHDSLQKGLNVDEADVTFTPGDTGIKRRELAPFDASVFLKDFDTSENESTSFDELEEAVNTCNREEEISNSEVKKYTDEFVIRPSESFNDRGIRRLAVSAHHLDLLKSLGYSIATEYTKPLSPSAILYNIIEAHLQSYRKEIDDLVEMGERNKSIYL